MEFPDPYSPAPGVRTSPGAHAPRAVALFDRMLAAQRQLIACEKQLVQALLDALDTFRIDDGALGHLLDLQRTAAWEATTAYEEWQAAGYPGLPLAPDGPFADLPASTLTRSTSPAQTESPGPGRHTVQATVVPSPAPPLAAVQASPRLHFAKWLYAQGRISG